MELSADEVGLILPGFLRKLLICLMIDPLTWLTLYECVWEFFGSEMDLFVADVLPYTRPLPLAW